MKKEHFSHILAIILFLSVNLVQIHAQEAMKGSGTEANPFQITNAQQLSDIRNYNYMNSPHFKLMNDIDLAAWISGNSNEQVKNFGWEPIPDFMGILDGNGFVIKNLWMNSESEKCGLFSSIDGATIKRLGILIDPSKGVKGTERVGALIGQVPAGAYPSIVEECYVKGNVESAEERAGGLVGDIKGPITIKRCYSVGSVKGKNRVGGIVGGIQFDLEDNITSKVAVTIDECYSVADILATSTEASIAGITGLIYWHNDLANLVSITISNCLAANISIKGPDLAKQWNHRRIWGWAQESDLVIQPNNRGYNKIMFIGDVVVEGETGGRNGLDITPEDILLQSSYSNWDFKNTWQMYNNSYQLPVLKKLKLENQPNTKLPHIGAISSASSVTLIDTSFFRYENGIIHIDKKVANDSLIRIYTLSGENILETRETSVDISAMPRGIYILSLGKQAFKLAVR